MTPPEFSFSGGESGHLSYRVLDLAGHFLVCGRCRKVQRHAKRDMYGAADRPAVMHGIDFKKSVDEDWDNREAQADCHQPDSRAKGPQGSVRSAMAFGKNEGAVASAHKIGSGG